MASSKASTARSSQSAAVHERDELSGEPGRVSAGRQHSPGANATGLARKLQPLSNGGDVSIVAGARRHGNTTPPVDRGPGTVQIAMPFARVLKSNLYSGKNT